MKKQVKILLVFFLVVLAIFIAVPATLFSNPIAISRIPGDVNGDGVVTAADVGLLRAYLAGHPVTIDYITADVNGDGAITAADVGLLRAYLAGHPVELRLRAVGNDTPDSQFLSPDDIGVIGSGPINRLNWLTMLIDAANLDASYYTRHRLSSFYDIDTRNYWFMARFPGYDGVVEVAFQNNVITSSTQDGYLFHPALTATEAFAVVTAVRALGFYVDGYHNLTDIFAIAQDIGLFTGVPTTGNLSQSQADAIISVVADIAAPMDFGSVPVIEVDYNENLVWLSDDLVIGYYFNFENETGTLQVAPNAAAEIAVGDVIILPGEFSYIAKRITAIYSSNDEVHLETELPDLEDLIAEGGGVYIKGRFEADIENFTLNPNLQDELGQDWLVINELDGDITPLFVNEMDDDIDPLYVNELDEDNDPLFMPLSSASNTINIGFGVGSGGRRNISVSIAAREGTESINITSTVYVPELSAFVDIRRGWLGLPVGVNYFRMQVENQVSNSIGGSTTLFRQDIKLGQFYVPISATIGATVAMYLEATASGSITITYTLVSVVGFDIVNGHPRFFQEASTSKTVNLSVSARAGVKGQVMLRWFYIPLADVNAHVGLGATGSIIMRDNPPPATCLGVGAHIYLSLSALQNGLISRLLPLRINIDIWNNNNSPWRESWHFCDDVLTERCIASIGVDANAILESFVGVFRGRYYSTNSVWYGATITISETGDGAFEAYVELVPDPYRVSNNTDWGSWLCDVYFDEDTNTVSIRAREWVNRYPNWLTMDSFIYCVLSGDESILSGAVARGRYGNIWGNFQISRV